MGPQAEVMGARRKKREIEVVIKRKISYNQSYEKKFWNRGASQDCKQMLPRREFLDLLCKSHSHGRMQRLHSLKLSI